MFFQSSLSLREKLVSKDISAVDLTSKFLQRIGSLNGQLNAIVIDNREAALQKAAQLDKDLRDGESIGPLHGVPITIKEAFNIKGLKTTVNFPQLKNNVATDSSILIERLSNAGAIILGKTNVPQLLADSQTFGPLYPSCNNPFDITRTPGGSTGGGAAAVASGMSCFEIGSDIGGSIRNPSHYCGIFGLKPTQNGHVQDGHVPPLPNTGLGFLMQGCTGPLARSVDDLKIAYDVAFTPRWDYQQYLPVQCPTPKHSSLKDYKVAWFDEIGVHTVSDDTKKVLSNAAKKLADQGVKVEKIKLDPLWAQDIYNTWATLFGLVIGQDFNWMLRKAIKLKFRFDAKGSKLNAYEALSKGLNLDFIAFSKALRIRQECMAEFSRLFDQYDFILSPTSVGEAFEHNPKHKPILVDGRSRHYADYCFPFVTPFNTMGNPVLVVPGQSDTNKMPIGIQCIGRHYSEQQLLHFGKLLEGIGFSFRPPNI